MKSDELRSLFLKFFEEKGHKVIPSSSLIPVGDPTLLLTNAGMVQIKPYFLGEQAPPSRRLASCQKCFRTSDIESVGDATHCTFFEMLGNFSVGDYFKKEAIAWGWEFVTERLKLPAERLWVTIFLDDDESFEIWRKTGVPAGKIVRFGEKDNFWGPAGSSGPCGPCSEIHYDFGEDKGCGNSDCRPNCECGRFTELWNLVFTQYNQDEKGNRTPLPRPNIDTGMGFERLVTIMQGKRSIYDTDIFRPLLETVSTLTGKRYGAVPEDDTAMRVIAEHGRALAFLIADGVLPDNEGRGYVLRRLLRRGALFGRRLGLDKPFLSEIAAAAVKKMGRLYPELKQREDFIQKVITQEETRFEETLTTGLEIIDGMLSLTSIKKARVISGADAFKLYDTYGFPVELTKEIVSKQGFSVDIPGFEAEMENQRERARASHKFDIAAGPGVARLNIPGTEFVGYTCMEQKAKVVKILVDGKETDSVQAGQSAGVMLDTTPFYGEMGGQVGDTGEVSGADGRFAVTGTARIQPDVILHQGKVIDGSLRVGDEVQAAIDAERRKDIARNHTATHLLQAALREVLGGHIQQRGSLVAPDRLRFDFSHLSAMTREEIGKVQRIVNGRVRQNLRVYDEESDYKKAVASGAIALFDEKYGDTVRVLRIGGPSAAVSAELCGGTHVFYTGEIGYFYILSEGSIGAGLRRIEAVTGRAAEAFIEQNLGNLNGVAQSLETTPEKVREKIAGILEEMDRQKKLVLSLERDKAKKAADSLGWKNFNGVKVIAEKVEVKDQQILRETADILRHKLGSGIIVLGALIDDRPAFIATVSDDLVAEGHHAGKIINQVSRVAGGGGGGKPNFAQAGGKDKNKLDEALGAVEKIVGER
ncbi:MAG: alanine--tRNA ligase [Chloroflexi bacterium RBG_13_57_8]|nr:MAG: alanine--tRNA ligase [Chloroflexi bacterium RBG_13_57_8]